jgi:exopolysaccharide biosynthesis protein
LPRHPRTALGWNDEHFFLVVVDGRQEALSVGMTYRELAALMRRLGCTHAMNLDGGGSSTLWLGGRIMNSPSDGRERPVANSLIVISDEPKDTP